MASSLICKDDQGSFIPATQRPDGSWRKPRRVKDGYVPQDEVPLYESKGKQWANRGQPQYPPGLHPDLIKKKEIEKKQKQQQDANSTTYSPIPGLVIQQSSNESKSKKKKKKSSVGSEAASGSPGNGKSTVTTAAEWIEKTSKNKQKKQTTALSPDTNATSPANFDPAKRLKNVRKKLREIEELEQKIEAGQRKSLDKDQLEKVSRKSEVLSEMVALQLTIENTN